MEAAHKDFLVVGIQMRGWQSWRILKEYRVLPSQFERFIAKRCRNASLRHSQEHRCREFREVVVRDFQTAKARELKAICGEP
jgi:hypothetical protein